MNILNRTVAGAVLAAVSATGAWADSSDPIKIPINEWTGQHISAHITGSLLRKAGYTVEYVTAGAVPQFAAIAQGDLHLQPETWTNNVGDIYPKAVESGDIVVLGSLGLKPQEGWIYPPYMNDKCPGLPSYDALYDCAQAFAAADTFPKGRLITYPADWGTRSKDVVAMIELPFEPVAGGSEGAMIAELKSAVAAEQPILMMFWQPHWIHAEITFDWVGWDPADGECVEESGQKRGSACGFQQATIDKIVSKDVAARWPGAYKLMEVISIHNATQNALMLEIDNKGRKLEEVIAEWVDANEATWGSVGRGREGRHELVNRRREGDAGRPASPSLVKARSGASRFQPARAEGPRLSVRAVCLAQQQFPPTSREAVPWRDLNPGPPSRASNPGHLQDARPPGGHGWRACAPATCRLAKPRTFIPRSGRLGRAGFMS